MFYPKNLPVWERVARVVVGLSVLAWGLVGLRGLPLGTLIALLGLVALGTGFVGFCPMCALVGRKTLVRSSKKGGSDAP